MSDKTTKEAMRVIKRDGREVPFDISNIENAVYKAARHTMQDTSEDILAKLAKDTAKRVAKAMRRDGVKSIGVEDIQDLVENTLMATGNTEIARNYILYRENRTLARSIDSKVMDTLKTIIRTKAVDNDMLTENGNVNTDAPMGTMLKVASETSKEFYLSKVIRPEHAAAHREGYIHIHDLDFYGLTMTCCQIDIGKLFEHGFTTGHGTVRPPNSIRSACSLTCIAIQANQNDQHGGQSIPNFDYDLAPYVGKSFINHFKEVCEVTEDEVPAGVYAPAVEYMKGLGKQSFLPQEKFDSREQAIVDHCDFTDYAYQETIIRRNIAKALEWTQRETYQSMEALIHNLNTMHSRAGAQVPFSSINFGTDTSPEGRMVVREFLNALEHGLGGGETSIFPISIMRMLNDVNKKPGDPNYDIYELACRVSAKRLFPNFLNLDASYNKKYITYDKDKKINKNQLVASMGCRTRVIGNIHDKSREVTPGRGNLSFTTINLPRLALEASGDTEKFTESLKSYMALVRDQLLDRFAIQSHRHVYNYPFLMGNGVWMDSDKLGPEDEVGEVLKHGTLSIGFCGLAEAMVALFGKHHAEDENVWKFAYETISMMNDICTEWSGQYKLNFSVLATPAESTAGRFVRCDQKRYGRIPGVTERDYYTNSFHVPVYYNINWKKKIDLEAPFHPLCPAGEITYVEVSGDPSRNVEGFKAIVDYMMGTEVGYCSINHQVDYDPVCGYTGIIGDTCPRCGRKDGEAIPFETVQDIRKKFGCSC